MKRIFIISVICLMLVLTGCDNNDNKNEYQPNDGVKIVYIAKTDDEIVLPVLYTIYEDEKYRYLMSHTADAYVEYKGEKMTYEEALERKIVNINELINAKAEILKEAK